MNLRLLASTYAIIFVAELPDKTALASLVLATRNRALAVFLGAGLALTLQSIVATAAGRALSLLPPRAVHVGSGLVFLSSALWMWLRRTEEPEPEDAATAGFGRQLAKAFLVVFVAEWGDLTQLSTAALAASSRAPLTVLLGSTAALWSVVAIAAWAGHRAGRLLDPSSTQRIAAAVFASVGIALIVGWV